MSQAAGTIEQVALTLSRVLSPLAQELTPGRARLLLAELGIVITPAQETAIAPALQQITTSVNEILTESAALARAIEEEDFAALTRTSLAIITGVKNTVEGFSSIPASLNGLGLSVPAAVVNSLPERLLNYLLIRLFGYARGINELLEFTGILERTVQNDGSSDPTNPPFTVSTLHFEKIGEWLGSPGQQLQTMYGWGNSTFDGRDLLKNLEKLLVALGAPVFYDDTLNRLNAVLLEIAPKTDIDPKGLAISIKSSVTTGNVILVEEADWRLSFQLDFVLPYDTALIVQPNGKLTFKPSGTGSSVGGKLELRFEADRTTNPEAFILLGQAGGSRLQIGKFAVNTGVAFLWNEAASEGKGDFRIGGEMQEGKVLIDLSNADGFIGNILSNLKLETNFDLGFGYSTNEGLFFYGSTELIIQLPLHIALGPVELSALTIVLGIEGNKFPLSLGVNINANLGPLQAVVENIGFTANLELRENRSGNIGPLDLTFGFKPPNGVGLSVDAGVVKGGGYLFFDFDKQEYAGALELTFSGIVSLKAIGIITTRMPDGSDGFSLLIIITAEFGTGIQLGFGFVLLGVGGLLGLNRTMRLEPLAEGVRTGGINGIMFPTDVVANAPRIISDLRTYFPPEEGKFLIGPMARLGWGTPALITVTLGIIIEIPGNIAILGVLKIALPTEDAPIIILQINFIGAIEFDKSRLWFFASLYDSRILFVTLEGEMGLLVAWGDDANFVVSVGGFHPSFNPPPLPFGRIARLSLNILNESWGRIRVMAYFAVTSNTVQFGAHAELYFGFSAINIDGHIGFDALFQFSPFYFIIELSASLSVKVFGIGLFSVRVSMSLEGPTPYRAKGTGSISLFFFDIDVDFDETWGESQHTILQPIRVMPLLKAEFDKLENWKAQLPAGTNILVSLRAVDAAAELVLHPVGTLQVSQRYVPLNITVDKVGAQKPGDVKKLTVHPEGTSGLSKKSDVKESFAMAQFQEMSSATKLSRPSFEKENGGLELSVSGQQVATGKAVKRIVRYELIVIDTNFKRFARKFFDFISGVLFLHFLKGNAIANSPLSYKTKKQYHPYDEKIEVKQGTYSVASVTNNKAFIGAANFASEAQAREFMQQQVLADPNLKESLHIIPNHELNTAA